MTAPNGPLPPGGADVVRGWRAAADDTGLSIHELRQAAQRGLLRVSRGEKNEILFRREDLDKLAAECGGMAIPPVIQPAGGTDSGYPVRRVAALEDRLRQLEAELGVLARKCAANPLHGAGEEFSCECGAEGKVMVALKCSACGEEADYGFID